MQLSRKTSLIIIAVLLLVAFLGGFIPTYLDNRELTAQVKDSQARLDEVQDRLRVAALQNDLGLILVQVEQNNFGLAKEHSTRLFDELRQAAATVRDGKLREQLTAVLNRRDEITTDLTALSPETAAKLRTLYLAFPQSTPLPNAAK
jgi:hypothetical protein